MVRETRHLWVGNLPENIREDRIREHFKRYGRVQSVKLLPRSLKGSDEGCTGMCATVAFMDIKSAAKAHNMEHKLDERCLSTEYYEPHPAPLPGSPAAASAGAPPPPLAYVASSRFPHGPPDDHGSSPFERSSHFYERRGVGAVGSVGAGDGVVCGVEAAYLRRMASAAAVAGVVSAPPGYHPAVAVDPLRGRARDRERERERDRERDRLYRNGPSSYVMLERSQPPPPPHHRVLGNAWALYESAAAVAAAASASARGYGAAASSGTGPADHPYGEELRPRGGTDGTSISAATSGSAAHKKQRPKSSWTVVPVGENWRVKFPFIMAEDVLRQRKALYIKLEHAHDKHFFRCCFLFYNFNTSQSSNIFCV